MPDYADGLEAGRGLGRWFASYNTERPHQALAAGDGVERECQGLDLGDQRRNARARAILQARWDQPQASFYGSFAGWTPAKGAYDLVEHQRADIHLGSWLAPHHEQTLARMAAEPLVLLPQDTTTWRKFGRADPFPAPVNVPASWNACAAAPLPPRR